MSSMTFLFGVDRHHNLFKYAKSTIFSILFAFAFFHPTNIASVSAACLNTIWVEQQYNGASLNTVLDNLVNNNLLLFTPVMATWSGNQLSIRAPDS